MSDFNDKNFDKFLRENTSYEVESKNNEWNLIHQKISKLGESSSKSFWNSKWLLVASTVFSVFMVLVSVTNQETSETDELSTLISMTMQEDADQSYSKALFGVEDIEHL